MPLKGVDGVGHMKVSYRVQWCMKLRVESRMGKRKEKEMKSEKRGRKEKRKRKREKERSWKKKKDNSKGNVSFLDTLLYIISIH